MSYSVQNIAIHRIRLIFDSSNTLVYRDGPSRDQLVFWGASKFSNLLAPRASKFCGGPVSFQIYWPPGPLDPQAQCQGLLLTATNVLVRLTNSQKTLLAAFKYLHSTVVPVMNGHPRVQAKVSVHCRWPLIRGTDGHVEMSRGIDNMAVNSRWPLTGVAQGRYYCIGKWTRTSGEL